jgi:hypothetical protein
MSKAAEKIMSSKTAEEKAAIASHAARIYTALPGKMPLTPQNEPGNKDVAERAIALAEFFHDMLEAHGYSGGSRK